MYDATETTYLLSFINHNGLSVIFSIICVIDIFGVFPIVTLPKTIVDCGIYGILIVITVCSLQMYTATLLGRCWIIAEKLSPNIRKKYRYPYSALAEFTYGKNTSRFVTFLLDLTIFGAGIPNLIVASQNLQLFGERISYYNVDVSFCYWIIVFGFVLCPILWLGSPKDMKFLCSLSVGIVVLVFLLIVSCLLFTSNGMESRRDYFPEEISFWKNFFLAYGTIAFQFDIHPTVLTIQMDMNDKEKIQKVVCGGFIATLSMFSVITVLAVVKYGSSIQPSILETLPTSVPLHFAAILVSLQLCLTSAISNSALYQHMEDCLSISRNFNRKRCILRTILTLLSIIIAESVPRFDLVMSLIGGTLTGPLVFILPPLFYIKIIMIQREYEKNLILESFTNIVYSAYDDDTDLSKYRENKFAADFGSTSNLVFEKSLMQFEFILCVCIIVFTGCATILTTYLNLTNELIFGNFTQPCIYNLTASLLYL